MFTLTPMMYIRTSHTFELVFLLCIEVTVFEYFCLLVVLLRVSKYFVGPPYVHVQYYKYLSSDCMTEIVSLTGN